MTASVSPLATADTDGDRELLDRARLVGGDLVLHLHRLDDADQRALLDGGSGLDGDLQHRALQRRGERVAARRRRRRWSAPGAAACARRPPAPLGPPRPRRRRRTAGRSP